MTLGRMPMSAHASAANGRASFSVADSAACCRTQHTRTRLKAAAKSSLGHHHASTDQTSLDAMTATARKQPGRFRSPGGWCTVPVSRPPARYVV